MHLLLLDDLDVVLQRYSLPVLIPWLIELLEGNGLAGEHSLYGLPRSEVKVGRLKDFSRV